MTPTLESRVARLEAHLFTDRPTVNGWEAAARFLRKSVPTVKRLARTDPRFPRPIRSTTFKRADRKKASIRPEWRTSDLLNYHTAHG